MMNELNRISKLESEVALLGRRLTLVERSLPRGIVADPPAPAVVAEPEVEAPKVEAPPVDLRPAPPKPPEPAIEFPVSSFSPPLPPLPLPPEPVWENAPRVVPEPPFENISALPATGPRREPSPPSQTKSLLDWENLIGGQWALWIGALCLFLACASFLAYTWRYLPPPPPWAKVAMGLGAGAVLLGAGEWFRTRTQKWFSEGLSGAGLSICYLSLWAAEGFFHIMSPTVAFGGMALLTALGVALAVRAKAPALSMLSTIGGFLTPVLLQSGQSGSSQGLSLLTYVAVLNMGIVAVSLFQRWRGLTWLSFVGTFLLVGGWAIDAPIAAIRGPLFLFLCLYFVLFLGAACFYSLARQEETAPEDLLLLFATSSLFAPAGYAVISPVLGKFPGFFALGLAAFWGLTAAGVRVLAPRNVSLRYCLGGLSLLALTVAVPMQLKGPWLAISWAGEAGILLALSRRFHSPLFLRAGQVVWVLAGCGLISLEDSLSSVDRLTAWAMFLIVSAGAATLARRNSDGEGADELGWAYTTACLLGTGWLLGREAYEWLAPSSSAQRTYAWLFIAPLEAVLAMLAFGIGLRARYQLVRLEALAMLLISAFVVVAAGVSSPLTSPLPFEKARLIAFAVVTLVLSATGWLIARHKDELPADEIDVLQGWSVIIAGFVLVAASIETYFAFEKQGALQGTGGTTLAFMLSVLWSGYGAALLSSGKTAKDGWLRVFAWSISGIGISAAVLAALMPQSAAAPVFNWRFAAFAMAMLSLGVGARRAKQDEIEADTFTFLALTLGLWLATEESYEACRYFASALGPNWQRVAQMTISLVWTVYAAGMLVGGIARRAQQVRLVALGLLCLTVVKIFLFDLAFLNGPWRAVSLGGMGITLIFISWLYSRFGTEKREVE